VIKLALPGGDIRDQAAAMLSSLGLHSGEYTNGSRAYRFRLTSEEAELRVFREKDIPIEIALGNYDLGICNRIWMDELQARFPQEEIVALRSLGFGATAVVVAAAPETLRELGPIEHWPEIEGIRIVSEFPNLAETFALAARLPRYHVMPVWGAAASYPPEDADLAVFADSGSAAQRQGLVTVARLATGSACVLANRSCLARKDLSAILTPLLSTQLGRDAAAPSRLPHFRHSERASRNVPARTREEARLALPDGHAQRHTFAALTAARLEFEGYGEKDCVSRPKCAIPGLSVKVIRPQDMPQQVALGNFDLAVTGRDWLLDHRIAFPSSPVVEVADLRRSRYTLCAVVDERIPGDDLASALAYWRASGRTEIRIASEYANLADQFARERRIGRYQIIPVAGASEGFVPEDAEILIEGTETGTSVAANRLKIIDRIFESTNCLIARQEPPPGAAGELVASLIERLRASTAVSV
jgi:ATP phosphoribosyltransferase